MFQILLTNSIWIDDDVTLKEEGLDALKDSYYCYSYEADFDDNNQATNKAIEDFISDKTKGLIEPTLTLPRETLFVLMNTLYLKDIWNEMGEDLSYASSDYKFTNRNGSVSNKQLLSGYYQLGKVIQQETFEVFKTSTMHGLDLYFVKGKDNQDIKDVFNKETINYVLDKDNFIYQDSNHIF